ncbi:GCN5-related N-acetyltransferase [Xylanimonas cellulosilytica DSM 15894]|uniref:GCN5-related N-acetyltransferase n=1 Tax=Xylanimonas cellulosilytica (strain DSM 15894 / JCM 12276 / CECT 5975 / KCTC 9989 / LMG 20990 / NBRC 107835 / XIL07) TaxID=446471 RepID=D1BXY0_XYLCX|nr:N-acetyltransferase [Xylanimonas cellulosilytica]ACZ31771.1 GCN5-related N-acetyltransferase [Xylanimonas cellulosilytica DSM 15894]
MPIAVVPLTDLPAARRPEVARVFAAAYAQDLSTISSDRAGWAVALAPAFVPGVCFVALDGGSDADVLGLAACSHGSTRALRLDPRALRRGLGVVRGTFAFAVMRRTFHRPLPYPETTGYVECVATAPAARGRGVATALMEHLHGLPYDEFVLEVTDVNDGARRLYERLGYRELRRKRSRAPWLTGYREALYLGRSRGGETHPEISPD